jgi:hypothetical protein
MIFATQRLAQALVATGLLAASLSAHAGLIGSTVSTQYYFNGGAYTGAVSFTADGANHTNSLGGYFGVQVTDTQVIYDYTSAATWNTGNAWSSGSLYIENGNLLDFLGAPNITSVTLDAASNMVGFDASRITFDTNSIAVNWAGLSFNSDTRVVLNVAAGTLPEPASYALVIAALAGVGLARRRKA